jgi:predicted TIM-barrel fold metal-dependent hydrolase
MSSQPASIDRRSFLQALLGWAALGPALGACAPEREHTREDTARLAEQRRREQERSGQGPYGRLRFRGYRGLAKLPYFELDDAGRLRVAVPDLPAAIDVHAHLGMSLLFAPSIDLLERTPRVRHFLDCDATNPGCELDLDVYVNANFDEPGLSRLRRELASQFLWGNDAARTHTLPNLVDEMDAMGIARAAILPIAFGLPFGDRLTERWMQAIETSGASDRLLPCASVHPRDELRLEKLRAYARRGARAIKLHPAGQRFFADESGAMELYAECERLGLPVIFHAGRAGIEPEAALAYNLMRHYVGAVESFPGVRFVLGHAGARDVAEAIPLARRHANVWLGCHGQGVTQLHELLEALGPGKLLFGSDWPWYHLGATLAKLLIVTEGDPAARFAVLRGNAEQVLGGASQASGAG